MDSQGLYVSTIYEHGMETVFQLKTFKILQPDIFGTSQPMPNRTMDTPENNILER